jgi:hypothetical protein
MLWNMACSFWLSWAANYEVISASIDEDIGAKFDSSVVHCKITKTNLGEALVIRWVSSHLS